MSISVSDRYTAFIQQMIDDTLKGKVRSKAYIANRLARQLAPVIGEVFEQCLSEQTNVVQDILNGNNERQRLKAQRQARALRMIEEVWESYRKTQQTQGVCDQAVAQLMKADERDRLLLLAQVLDPNQTNALTRQQIEQLAQALKQIPVSEGNDAKIAELHQMGAGLNQGLVSYKTVELHLVSWLYDRAQNVGFGAESEVNNPWNHWAKYIDRPLPKMLFAGQSQNQSAAFLVHPQTVLGLKSLNRVFCYNLICHKNAGIAFSMDTSLEGVACEEPLVNTVIIVPLDSYRSINKPFDGVFPYSDWPAVHLLIILESELVLCYAVYSFPTRMHQQATPKIDLSSSQVQSILLIEYFCI